jgi:hypothetical protein
MINCMKFYINQGNTQLHAHTVVVFQLVVVTPPLLMNVVDEVTLRLGWDLVQIKVCDGVLACAAQGFGGSRSFHGVAHAKDPKAGQEWSWHPFETTKPPMRVFVGVKRVVDYAAKIRVKPDKSGMQCSL